MSFSISVVSKTKEDAKADFRVKFEEEVIAHQPDHAFDRAAIMATVDAFIDLLSEDTTRTVEVRVSGGLGWAAPGVYNSTSVQVYVYSGTAVV